MHCPSPLRPVRCRLLAVDCLSPLSPLFPLLTRHSPVSPIISTHTQNHGGGGALPHDAFASNPFVFCPYVNYVDNYMYNYIVGAPTFCSVAARRRFCARLSARRHSRFCIRKEGERPASEGRAQHKKEKPKNRPQGRPLQKRTPLPFPQRWRYSTTPFGAFALITDSEPNQPLHQPGGIGTTCDP